MRIKLIVLTLLLAASALPFLLRAKAAAKPVVQVNITAMDPNGFPLHYKWKSTDGTIVNVDAPTTTWTLPAGPGLHFAYVLISNSHGGYTERRIIVSTDVIGIPPVIPAPTTLAAPPAPAQVGDFYRSSVEWGFVNDVFHDVYVPNVSVYIQNSVSGQRYPATGSVKTDLKGSFTIPGVPPGTYNTFCAWNGGTTFVDCTGGPNGPNFHDPYTMPAQATTDYLAGYGPFGVGVNQPINGHVTLHDGNLCGTSNEFFGVTVTATASLLNSTGTKLAGPVKVNAAGDYQLPYNKNAATVSLACESNSAVNVTIGALLSTSGTDLGSAVVPASAPVVTAGSAVFNGSTLPPPSGLGAVVTGFPSDINPRADGFLAEKGLDTRVGACKYYQAIGAVQTCSAAGVPTGAISFDDWQRAVKIGKYAVAGTTEYVANYINKMDLNLTRNHHSISYGPNKTAAYVCNHLGPPAANPTQFENPTQTDINTAVDNAAVNNINLVACVAMDNYATAGVNGGAPFTRYYIFGPSGQLLLSVNLDGRREKFVPGTCIVCHGGDHYAGKFPEDGTGPANVGAHFLPYDTGNFLFSNKAGLTEAAQEESIYNLNQNVLKAGPAPAAVELINGWYQTSHVLNKNYLPTSWQNISTNATSFYTNVLARSCRSCHVNMIEGYNFDHQANITPTGAFYRSVESNLTVGIAVCGNEGGVFRDHSMPNSLVTLNRFWDSSGTSVDQPVILTNYFGFVATSTGKCTEGLLP